MMSWDTHQAIIHHLKGRSFAPGCFDRWKHDSPGHYFDELRRKCVKCYHTDSELFSAERYIPCLDEMEPVEHEKPPPTLMERAVTSLEGIEKTLRTKDFKTDLTPITKSLDEVSRTIWAARRR